MKQRDIGAPFSSPSSVNPLAAIGRDVRAVAQPADLIEEALSSDPVGGDVAQRAARHAFDRKHDRLNLKADGRSATLLTQLGTRSIPKIIRFVIYSA